MPCTIRLINPLFCVDNPDSEGGDYVDLMNPESMVVYANARVEPSLKGAQPEAPYQFERQGYFVRDNQLDGLVFNRTVSLKDSWSKPAKPVPAPASAPKKATKSDDDRRARKRRARTEIIAELHAADPELAERMQRYVETLGLPAGDAQTLTSDRSLSDFFEDAMTHQSNAKAVSNWVVNAVQASAKESGFDGLRFTGADIAGLVSLVEAGTISSKGAKKVYQALESEGGVPQEIVQRLGLAQLNDPDKIAALVNQAIADNPAQLAQYLSLIHI